MKVNSSLTLSLTAHSNLVKADNRLKNSISRLTSGSRINSAADDAAGLSISQKMRRQVNGLVRAEMNAQDGMSMVQTADGALGETQSMVQRMRELALHAMNDTLTNNDRLEIQSEIEELKLQINEIAQATEFNTKKLLNGNQTALVTSSSNAVKTFVSGNINATGNYEVSLATVAGGISQIQRSQIFTDLEGNIATGSTKLENISRFYGESGESLLDIPQTIALTSNGKLTTITLDKTMSLSDLAQTMQDAIASKTGLDIAGSKTKVIANSAGAKDGGYLQIVSGTAGNSGEFNIVGSQDIIDALGFNISRSAVDTQVKVSIKDAYGNFNSINTSSGRVDSILSGLDIEFTSKAAQIAGQGGVIAGLRLESAQSFKLQIQDQIISVAIATGNWSLEGISRVVNVAIETAKTAATAADKAKYDGVNAKVADGQLFIEYANAPLSQQYEKLIQISDANADTIGIYDGTYNMFVQGNKDTKQAIEGISMYKPYNPSPVVQAAINATKAAAATVAGYHVVSPAFTYYAYENARSASGDLSAIMSALVKDIVSGEYANELTDISAAMSASGSFATATSANLATLATKMSALATKVTQQGTNTLTVTAPYAAGDTADVAGAQASFKALIDNATTAIDALATHRAYEEKDRTNNALNSATTISNELGTATYQSVSAEATYYAYANSYNKTNLKDILSAIGDDIQANGVATYNVQITNLKNAITNAGDFATATTANLQSVATAMEALKGAINGASIPVNSGYIVTPATDAQNKFTSLINNATLAIRATAEVKRYSELNQDYATPTSEATTMAAGLSAHVATAYQTNYHYAYDNVKGVTGISAILSAITKDIQAAGNGYDTEIGALRDAMNLVPDFLAVGADLEPIATAMEALVTTIDGATIGTGANYVETGVSPNTAAEKFTNLIINATAAIRALADDEQGDYTTALGAAEAITSGLSSAVTETQTSIGTHYAYDNTKDATTLSGILTAIVADVGANAAGLHEPQRTALTDALAAVGGGNLENVVDANYAKLETVASAIEAFNSISVPANTNFTANGGDGVVANTSFTNLIAKAASAVRAMANSKAYAHYSASTAGTSATSDAAALTYNSVSAAHTFYAYSNSMSVNTLSGILSAISKDIKANAGVTYDANLTAISGAITTAGVFADASYTDLEDLATTVEALRTAVGGANIETGAGFSGDQVVAKAKFYDLLTSATSAIRATANVKAFAHYGTENTDAKTEALNARTTVAGFSVVSAANTYYAYENTHNATNDLRDIILKMADDISAYTGGAYTGELSELSQAISQTGLFEFATAPHMARVADALDALIDSIGTNKVAVNSLYSADPDAAQNAFGSLLSLAAQAVRLDAEGRDATELNIAITDGRGVVATAALSFASMDNVLAADLLESKNLIIDMNKGLQESGVAARADFVNGSLVFTSLSVGASEGNDGGLGLEVTSGSELASVLGLGTTTVKASGDAAFKLGVVEVNTQFHIGANTGEATQIQIGDMSVKALGLDKIDLTSTMSATKALKRLDIALEKVSYERSKIGSYQNRLAYSISNLHNASMNLTAAESRISGVDMAKEVIEFTRDQVVQQAANSMFVQANVTAQSTMVLLA